MQSIFEVPWERVEVEDVGQFLSSASGEGLIWEGKATASLRELRSKIVAGVCGLANQLGGFFILGAAQHEAAWTLESVEDDAGEDAQEWLARILNGNLVNPPPFDVRRWHPEDGRVIAVIRVEQAAVPPCMTKDGIVYQRLVGETRRVTDPRVLFELIAKGAEARAEAERRAVAAVHRLLDSAHLVGTPESLRVAVALAPTTAVEDYSARLFTPGFTEVLYDDAVQALGRALPDTHLPYDDGGMHRDGYVVRRGRFTTASWQWGLKASWDGTIAVELALPREHEAHPPTADTIIRQAWSAAARALPALTGIPDRAHVAVHVAVRMTSGFRIHLPDVSVEVRTGAVPIQRWATMAEPTDAEIHSVFRELARSAGAEEYEPEPSATNGA